MKKIITIAFAVVLTAFGASPASAQTDADGPTAADCVEADTVPAEFIDECQAIANDESIVAVDGLYPVTAVAGEGGELPDTTTTTTTTTAPPVAGERGPVENPTLPATGGSGSSGLLQGGAVLLVAGAVFFVAARRREPVTA